tara:strand:- start:2292 stop:3431 length:1140 start_codon:yes stop_codon:yes gene_type:complete
MSALTVDTNKMNKNNNNETTNSVGAPVKPSFINYSGSHFDYNGTVEYFLEQMDKVSIVCCCDLSYNTKTYEYEVVAYPNDTYILYAVQIFCEPKRNCHVIEFRRLDGCGFTYRDHIMEVWTELKERDIGPGVSTTAKPKMPTLDMKSLDKDDDFSVGVDALQGPLNLVRDKVFYKSHMGLTMLISAVKNPETRKAFNETRAMTIVMEVGKVAKGMAKLDVSILQVVSAILREGAVRGYHEEMVEGGVLEFALDILGNSHTSTQKEILEVQRNFVDVLISLVGIYYEQWHGEIRGIKEVIQLFNPRETTTYSELDRLERKIQALLYAMENSPTRDYFDYVVRDSPTTSRDHVVGDSRYPPMKAYAYMKSSEDGKDGRDKY